MRFLTSIFLIFSQQLFCQTIQIFDPLDSKHTRNIMIEIEIDSAGNKWIATTDSGLLKFNGSDFEFYNESNSEIKGDCVSSLFIDSKGNMWVSYYNSKKNQYGFVKYDGISWTKINKKIIAESIFAITEDTKGNIYFGGSNTLIMFDGNNWIPIKLPKGNYVMRSIAIDSNGTIAIGHHYGLLIKKNNVWKSYKIDEEIYNIPSSLVFDKNGDLYIGYYGRGDTAFSILDNKGKFQQFSTSNSKMPNNCVGDIKIDKIGNKWISTNDGLVKINNGKITTYQLMDESLENFLYGIAIEKNTIWITSYFGLIKFNE